MCSSIGELQETRSEVLRVEWRIDDFPLSSESEITVYKSPDFRFSNSSWSLDMCANGECEESSSVSVALYLRRTEGFETEVVICEFCVKQVDSIVGPPPVKFVWKFNGSDAYGTSEICKSSILLRARRNLVSSDALTVICTLRNLSSLQELTELSEELNDMLISERLTDVTLQVGEQMFEAHKVILAAHSPLFADMFEQGTLENNLNIVIVADCDPESFEDFLQFFYSGRANITADNVFHLYKTAKNHFVLDLMTRCVAYMIQHLSVDNVFDVALHGDKYSEQELFDLSRDFFETNIQVILCTSKWERFLCENPSLAYRLLKTMAPKIRIEK